jgi:serine/threonine-protein kinase
MFAIASNGTLVYRTGDVQDAVAALRTLVWVDRQGHEEPLGVPPRAYAYMHLSPDSTKLALDIRDQEYDIWTWDLVRHGPLTRLTFDPGFNRVGVWQPDGKRIAFSAERDGAENIYLQAADGTGTAEQLTKRPSPTVPHAFTPDGAQLLFITPAIPPFDIGVVNRTGDRRVDLLLHGPQSETNPEISPDGKWLAYESDESGGVPEIYVRPFPNIEAGRWQISSGGGSRPVWARSGRELFYESPEPPGSRTLKIWAVPVEAGATFTTGPRQRVVDGPYLSPQSGRSYDVSADGKKFVMIKNATPTPTPGAVARPSQLVVVLNWQEELKQRVPAN